MSTKKQYFRDIKPGDVSVEGRQSNGFTADKKGNVIFYSGLKDSELDNLEQQNNNKNIPLYYNNSYFGVIKSEVHDTLNLGSNNYETLNEKVTDPNKITQINNSVGYETIITTNATITIPKGKIGPISVLVFYPGINIDGKEGKIYMPPKVKDGISDFYDKYVIVIPNNNKTLWNNVKTEYENELKKYNLTEKNLSVGIYSGSGNNDADIPDYIDKLNNLVNFMIMDPWPGTTLTKKVKIIKEKGVNIYTMYNPDAWGGYPTYPNSMDNLLKALKDTDIKKTSIGHRKIPTSFLNTFKIQIEANLGLASIPALTGTSGTSGTSGISGTSGTSGTSGNIPPSPEPPLPNKEKIERVKPAPQPPGEGEEDIVFLEDEAIEPVPVSLTGILDIDQGNAPEEIETGNENEKYVEVKPTVKRVINTRGSKPNEFLPRDEKGNVAPYFNMLDAAKASINTYTKDIAGVKGGKLGCAAGVSIIYMRAAGKNVDGKVSFIKGTIGFQEALDKDKNFQRLSNWRDAQPGDIIVTKTQFVGGKQYSGHIGIVSDTKTYNPGKDKTFDIISNSGGGYVGRIKNSSLAGSIQANYSIKSWESVAARANVGPTYAYRRIKPYVLVGDAVKAN